ncbi:MAG TPA: hypothetical protein VI028_00090, partial [Solirubrobacterales bacterium]
MRPRGQTSGGIGRARRRLIGTLAAAAALLVVPASAQATLGFTALDAQPSSNKQAGDQADFHIHVGFTDPSTDVHDIRIGLPPGQIGNPTVTPQCTVADFMGAGCAANTQVGSVVSNVAALGLLPLAVNGKLFNLVPNPGEPARFGILLSPTGGLVTLGDIKLQSSVELRSDFGLDTVIDDIPNTAAGLIPIDITSMDVTLFGDPPKPPFARNPTSCSPATTQFTAHSYAAPATAVTGEASYTPTGCENEDFSPSFSAIVGGANTSMKTSVTTSIDQDLDEAGLVKARVVIPPDLNPDVALLGNRCSAADFETSNCPPNSVIGSVVAASPLLSQPLAGNVVFVETGGTPDIGLDLQGQLHLLLRGSLGLDKVVVFDGLPDIPIAHFALTFPSAPGLLIASRNLCVPPPPLFHADFTGYNGATTAVDSSATVQGACGPNAATKC